MSPETFSAESQDNVWIGAASVLRNLLCTLISPTSSLNTCLWVMSRQGSHPKPAFTLHLSLSSSFSLSDSHSVWRIYIKLLFSVSVQCVIQDRHSAVRQTEGFTVNGLWGAKGIAPCRLSGRRRGCADGMSGGATKQVYSDVTRGVVTEPRAARSRQQPTSYTHFKLPCDSLWGEDETSVSPIR